MYDNRFETLKNNKAQIKALQAKIDELEKSNKDIAENILKEVNANEFSLCGVNIERITRKGAIDYLKIPELQGVDLEPYRKQASTFLQIREEKLKNGDN